MTRPALVKFLGNEEDYRLGCDETGWLFCCQCPFVSTCNKKSQYKFKKNHMYKAYFLEYWEGVRNSLHVEGEDGIIQDFIPLEDFEVIEDVDNVLTLDEALVKCIVHTAEPDLELKYGHIYKAIGQDKDGMYLVMDESYCCYFYPSDYFEIVEDEKRILSCQSVYYSCSGNSIKGYVN